LENCVVAAVAVALRVFEAVEFAVPLELQATWPLLVATETTAANTRTVRAAILQGTWDRML
jgi:hypothetical protein